MVFKEPWSVFGDIPHDWGRLLETTPTDLVGVGIAAM